MTTINISHAEPSPAKLIIHEWMQNTSETLSNHDVRGHLALISKEFKVHGVPDLEIIDYKD